MKGSWGVLGLDLVLVRPVSASRVVSKVSAVILIAIASLEASRDLVTLFVNGPV